MSRRGVTLIELLIALAITMIMMGAVVTLFANMTTSVTDSRAVIEVSERLRAVRNLLQADLAGHTAPTRPPVSPASNQGFLELIEGLKYGDGGVVLSGSKRTMYGQVGMTQNTILGDPDDVIHLTVHSNGKPFVGRVTGAAGTVMMESQDAEIIWFCLPNGRLLTNQDGTTTQLCTLYRRVLLVLPGYNLQGLGTVPGIYASNDISCRTTPAGDPIQSGLTIANTLGDLTKRENRFYHGATVGNNPPTAFPFQLNPANLQNAILSGNRLGEDVVLDNVLSFDMRVFDPMAAFIKTADGTIVGPSDPGYTLSSPPAPATINTLQTLANAGGFIGGYVDMGYGQYTRAPFIAWNLHSYFYSGAVNDTYSRLSSVNYNTYDTWSTSYEQDGYDQDGIGGIDQGLNGLDDPSAGPLAINGIIDDPTSTQVSYAGVMSVSSFPGERETMAPFPYPLRGVQVTIRVYEGDSRQIRQVTVTQDFVPE